MDIQHGLHGFDAGFKGILCGSNGKCLFKTRKHN